MLPVVLREISTPFYELYVLNRQILAEIKVLNWEQSYTSDIYALPWRENTVHSYKYINTKEDFNMHADIHVLWKTHSIKQDSTSTPQFSIAQFAFTWNQNWLLPIYMDCNGREQLQNRPCVNTVWLLGAEKADSLLLA